MLTILNTYNHYIETNNFYRKKLGLIDSMYFSQQNQLLDVKLDYCNKLKTWINSTKNVYRAIKLKQAYGG